MQNMSVCHKIVVELEKIEKMKTGRFLRKVQVKEEWRRPSMKKNWIAATIVAAICLAIISILGNDIQAAVGEPQIARTFPRSLESYEDNQVRSIWAILRIRANEEPFNLAATLIFFLAIGHTFMTGKFMEISHKWDREHAKKIARGEAEKESVHHGAELFHFLGEVEAVFGIWAMALVGAIVFHYDWGTAVQYISKGVNFTEAMFVVVIMALAATRPILRLAEKTIRKIAGLFGGGLVAQWLATLTIGPLLGSLITEPAAMTICALVLIKVMYEHGPSAKFKYATIGLLFVNISVGGTLTHFAAPPVLMVSGVWKWGTMHMLAHFGWKAVLGIAVSNAAYFWAFRKEMAELDKKYSKVRLKDEIQESYLKRTVIDAKFDNLVRASEREGQTLKAIEAKVEKIADDVRKQLEESYIPELKKKGIEEDMIREAFDERFEEIKLRAMRRGLPALLPPEKRGGFTDPDWDDRDDPVPFWVTICHILFMAWTIVNAHHPELFIPGLLFFLGFAQVTHPYQNRIDLKGPLLVGFFLGGLVIHGGVQAWWIAPILGSLSEIPLMLGATVLTAFNDNAAITFLSTLVPNFSETMKYGVVAGAVAGGGLTIIANAPNPAGVSILKKYFDDEVSPLGILKGALLPTAIVWLVFAIFG